MGLGFSHQPGLLLAGVKHQIGYEDHEIGNEYDAWKSRVHPEDVDKALQKIDDALQEPWPDFEAEFAFVIKMAPIVGFWPRRLLK